MKPTAVDKQEYLQLYAIRKTRDAIAPLPEGRHARDAGSLAGRDCAGYVGQPTATTDSANLQQSSLLARLFTMPGALGSNVRDTARVNDLASAEARAVLPPT